jgi:predicted phosphodiesterase
VTHAGNFRVNISAPCFALSGIAPHVVHAVSGRDVPGAVCAEAVITAAGRPVISPRRGDVHRRVPVHRYHTGKTTAHGDAFLIQRDLAPGFPFPVVADADRVRMKIWRETRTFHRVRRTDGTPEADAVIGTRRAMNIGLISDIHEDIDSLKTAFVMLERAQCDVVVCLGDIVGFTLPFHRNISSRDANACIAMIRDQCTVVTAGNHDLYAVRRTPQFTAGFSYPENWYALDYETRARKSRNRIWLYEDSELPQFLTPSSIEYLHSLPEFVVKEFDGVSILFSHFHYPDLSGSTIGYPRKAKHLREHFGFMEQSGCILGISGHGHPEGCVHVDSGALKLLPFASHRLQRTVQWLVCPCVANTSRPNGVIVFDTAAFDLDVIPLASRKNNRSGYT